MALPDKSLLEVRGGSKVTVAYLGSGNQEIYTGPALIGVGKNRGTVFHGDPSARREIASNSTLIKTIDPHALNETLPPGAHAVNVTTNDGTTVFSWPADAPGPFVVSVYKPATTSTPRTVMWTHEVAYTSTNYAGPQLNSSLSYVVEVEAGKNLIATSQFRAGPQAQAQLQAATSEAQKMAKANPEDPSSHVLLSTVQTQHGQHQQAANSIIAAVNSKPNEAAYMHRLGTMFNHMSNVAEADHWQDRAKYVEDNAPMGTVWGTGAYYDPDSWDWEDNE